MVAPRYTRVSSYGYHTRGDSEFRKRGRYNTLLANGITASRIANCGCLDELTQGDSDVSFTMHPVHGELVVFETV